MQKASWPFQKWLPKSAIDFPGNKCYNITTIKFIVKGRISMTEENIIKILGNRIRQIRKKMGLSQAYLAEQALFSKNYLGRLERGQINSVSIGIITSICKVLGITLSELFAELEDTGSTTKDDAYANDLYAQMIEKACYPPSVEGMPVSTLLQFLVYLPLIQPELLIDSLARIDGAFWGSESYVLKQINLCIKRIPASPAKAYADICARDLVSNDTRPKGQEDDKLFAEKDQNYSQYAARIKQLETLVRCYRTIKDIDV